MYAVLYYAAIVREALKKVKAFKSFDVAERFHLILTTQFLLLKVATLIFYRFLFQRFYVFVQILFI